MSKRALLVVAFVATAVFVARVRAGDEPAKDEKAKTPPPAHAEVKLDPALYASGIDHPLLALVKGRTVVLEGISTVTDEDEEGKEKKTHKVKVRIERTLLDRVETVAGVSCSVQEEKQFRDGALAHRTLEYLVQGKDGAVYVLGEDAFAADEKGAMPAEPTESHRVGRDWPRPAIVMPAAPKAGDRWEASPPVGEEKGSVAVVDETSATIDVGGVKMEGALVVRYTDLDSPDEPGARDTFVPKKGIVRSALTDGSSTLERVEPAAPAPPK
jgi:hypothetical protein